TYTYDAAGEHLLSVTGPQGTTSYTYVTGQGIAREHALASIAFPGGTHQYFQYDAQGRLIEQSRDGNAEAIRYAYTSPGGITMANAADQTVSILYDEFGQPALTIDALGHTIQYQYNAQEKLTKLTTPDGNSYQFTYNAVGSLLQSTDP